MPKASEADGSPLCGSFVHPRRVMLAVDGTPESKAATRWAVENMLNQGDQVLVFHAIKELKEIPTAMGMAPFSGASPEMQQAHMKVTKEKAKQMVQTTAAYCRKVEVKCTGEAVWGQRRKLILNRVMDAGITHLVMGTGKSGRRFGFLRKESLTSTITREAQCQVLLIDKKAQLVGRSSYNPDGRAASKRFPSSVKASESPAESDSEQHAPFDLHGRSPSQTLTTQSSLSSASSNLGEIEETTNPLLSPAYGTPPQTPDPVSSPVSVLLRNAKGASPLQRTSSVPSPLAKGGLPNTRQGNPPEGTFSEGHFASLPDVSELQEAAPAVSDVQVPGTAADVFRTESPPMPAQQRHVSKRQVTSSSTGSRPGSPSVRSSTGESPPCTGMMPPRRKKHVTSLATSGDEDEEAAEVARLRAEVRKLRLVSEMRAREAARFAQRLEATQSEADAVATQLLEESKRRKAAERTASHLVTILGTTAPEKVVDILSARNSGRA